MNESSDPEKESITSFTEQKRKVTILLFRASKGNPIHVHVQEALTNGTLPNLQREM